MPSVKYFWVYGLKICVFINGTSSTVVICIVHYETQEILQG